MRGGMEALPMYDDANVERTKRRLAFLMNESVSKITWEFLVVQGQDYVSVDPEKTTTRPIILRGTVQ